MGAGGESGLLTSLARTTGAPGCGRDGSMKIGILTGSVSRSAGGTFEAIRNMAQELHRLPQVDVSVFGIRDEAFDADAASWGSVPIEAFAAAGPRSFGYAADLYPALRHAAIDLLHVHGLWMYPSVAAQRWRRHTRRPGMISPHGMLDSWALANAGWKKRIAGLLYEDRHLRQGACIHALCQAEANAIREFGLRNPICVIPNGIDDTEASRVSAPDWRKELGSTAKVLLYLGRLHPKKGLTTLLEAWAAAPRGHGEAGEDWRLVIAGWDQGGHEQELRQRASQLGIAGSVRFVGPQFGTDKEFDVSIGGRVHPSLSQRRPADGGLGSLDAKPSGADDAGVQSRGRLCGRCGAAGRSRGCKHLPRPW